MVVFAAAINFKTCERFCADAVFGKHSLDSELYCELRTGTHKSRVLNLFKSSDITGMTAIKFLSKFFAGKDCFFGVYDDYVITAICMWCEAAVLPSGLSAASITYHLR